jgi:hypothetical protein
MFDDSISFVVHVTQRGEIGIELGGGLEMLFCVIGTRWRQMPS